MNLIKKIKISDFNYHLPSDKIAFSPLQNRDESKLLVFKNKTLHDSIFKNVSDFLTDENILVFNNSKVIHARIIAFNQTGAKIEIFCLEPVAPTTVISQSFEQTEQVVWSCFVGNAKKWKSPLHFHVTVHNKEIVITANKQAINDLSFWVTFTWNDPTVTFAEWLDAYGKMPLPPYIKREADQTDEVRYQTIYAKHEGSVAAPTAGLHFTDQVLQSIQNKGIETMFVTLHVGAGTFKPVTSEFVEEHYMHQEQIVVSKEMITQLLTYQNKKIIAVGTTVARTLESIYIIGAKLFLHIDNPFFVQQWEVYNQDLKISSVSCFDALQAILNYLNQNNLDSIIGETSLMIIPGYQHQLAKGILTNFHQPQSTLLLLIASYIGDNWINVYKHALQNQYRFLSYGDANLYL